MFLCDVTSVFISYIRDNRVAVETLHNVLDDRGFKVWRDQEDLYGGDAWPKLIGEAIRESDFFVLCWSKQAQNSYYVELEWTTAIALKKPIIPYLLDNTPLPVTLRSIQGVQSFEEVDKALQKPAPFKNRQADAFVIEKLGSVLERDPKKIIETIRIAFFQPNMHIEVNVAGDYIEKTIGQPKGKRLNAWYQSRRNQVAIIGAIGVILAAFITGWFTSGNREIVALEHNSIIMPNESDSSRDFLDNENEENKNPELSTSPMRVNGDASARYYSVAILIPASLSNAPITVDGETAKVIEQRPTIVTIKVKEKNSVHRISLDKNGKICTKERMIVDSMSPITFTLKDCT